jgi:hypothetical protein
MFDKGWKVTGKEENTVVRLNRDGEYSLTVFSQPIIAEKRGMAIVKVAGGQLKCDTKTSSTYDRCTVYTHTCVRWSHIIYWYCTTVQYEQRSRYTDIQYRIHLYR